MKTAVLSVQGLEDGPDQLEGVGALGEASVPPCALDHGRSGRSNGTYGLPALASVSPSRNGGQICPLTLGWGRAGVSPATCVQPQILPGRAVFVAVLLAHRESS